MRPRRLEVQGFTAFRDLQQIDFTELDLFVITGPTGAGKTSLLDAMALALYGQVPRMGKQGLGQLVSHGSAEARVLLEFTVNDELYRVSRRLPRRGAQQGRLERWVSDTWVDAVERGGIRPVNEAILEIVKLDFESFTKAIVLPQGEFARFLKGDPSERRKTLVALLGLGAYERMGALARDRSRTLQLKGEATRTILQEQYADATPEALADAEQALTTATQAADALARAMESAREAEHLRAQAAASGAAESTVAERLSAAAAELSAGIGACREVEAFQRSAATRLRIERETFEAADDELRQVADHRAAIVQRAGNGEQLARVHDALERYPALDQRMREAELRVTDAGARLAAATERDTSARVARDAVNEAVDRRLVEEKERTGDLERCVRSRDALRQRLVDVDAAVEEQELTSQALVQLERLAAEAEAGLSTARTDQVAAEVAKRQLDREHVVAALAVGLNPGDTCPVCDRPLAAHPAIDVDVERRLANAAARADAAGQSFTVSQRFAADAAAQLTAGSERVARAGTRLANALGDLTERSSLAAAVFEADARAVETHGALREASKLLTDARHGWQEAERMLAQAEADLGGATRDLEAARERRDEAVADRDGVGGMLRGYFGGAVPQDAVERVAALREELRAADERVERANRTMNDARASVAKADDTHRETQRALNEVDVQLARLRTRAEGAIVELEGTPLAHELDALPAPAEARDELSEQLAAWCAAAQKVVAESARRHEEAAAEATRNLMGLASAHDLEADDAGAALAALAAADRRGIDARARAEADRDGLRTRVQQRAGLESGIAQDMQEIVVLDVLATELRADHFVEFVVQETLDVLAVRASAELLRVSDGRYSLVSSDGEFSVVDHVNADEQRSVRTLSGGETFMASLSLALALSKHVSELAGEGLGTRLGAVFIDEGFGALDPETLEEVIDALERLREDALLVGVISHVPALAERIKVGLEVRKDGNRSVVTTAS